MTTKASPLTGLRVLDLGTHPASAIASMVLADFGAQVSCVAPSDGALAAHPAAPMLLRGKKFLQQPTGAEFDAALADADVLISTLGPDTAAPARLDRQVHLNISGWGMRGAYANYPMREGLVAAKSGRMMVFEGQAPRPGPAYAAVQVATHAAAQLGVQGILAALMVRDRTGRGQRVETSLLQGMMPYDVLGLCKVQFEPRFPDRLPPYAIAGAKPLLGYQPVQAKDGRWLQMGNLFDHLFKSYLGIAGLSGLPPEHELAKANSQWSPELQEMVRAAMLARMRERSSADWRAAFDASGNVAAAPYQTTQEALDDPDLLRPDDIVDCDHPSLGAVRWLGPVAHFAATPARIRATPVEEEGADAGRWTDAPIAPFTQGGDAGRTPLKGVTALEFASVVATPLALSGLADLGARVIKIEPIGGDPGRYIGMGTLELLAVKINAGKESICLELKSVQGREVLDKLLAKADLIAHNFRPGVPEKLGFGYARARELNPKVVWLSANGYHPDAPGADRPCAHPIAGAQCGGALYQAGGGMPPAGTDDIDALRENAERLYIANEANPDPNTSMLVGTAALLGLSTARRLGIGQQINVDMMLANMYANFDDALRYAGKPARAAVDSDLFGLHALYRLYPCRKGWVFLAVEGDAEFASLCDALRLAGLATDARFQEAGNRKVNDHMLAALLAAAFLEDAADAWEAKLGRVGIGCVRADAGSPGAFWKDDPHVRANEFVVARRHRRYGDYLRNAPLMSFSESEVRCEPGSLAGDHTDALLKELAYSADAIAKMRTDNIVWSEPLDPLKE